MYGMFDTGKSFKNHDLRKWNVKNVKTHNNFLRDAGSNNIEPKWVK